MAAIKAGLDAWASGTGSPYQLLADDVKWTIAGYRLASKTYASREALMSEVIRPFNARMSAPLVPTIQRLYGDGDTVIAHFDAKGTARDRKGHANSYDWILGLDKGRIVEATAFFDSIVSNDLWIRVTPRPESP